MFMNTTTSKQNIVQNNRILLETLLITTLSLGGILLLPQFKLVFSLLPIAYILIERRVRQRTWYELGFKFNTFWTDLRANWFWFVLVGIISQPVWLLIERVTVPEIVDHIIRRLPFPPTAGGLLVYAIPLAVALVGEELTHRTLIQGRLTPFIGTTAAIIVASLVFGISHYSPGQFTIVALDISSIVFDSILFGIIYARSNNLIVAWAAHFIGDILGLVFLISIM
jgi:membrane protease YdiL (CAAX protease family)